MTPLDSLTPGDRVELVYTDDEHTRLRPGDRGIVTRVGELCGWPVADVRWDSGSTLSMLAEAGDRVRRVDDETEETT